MKRYRVVSAVVLFLMSVLLWAVPASAADPNGYHWEPNRPGWADDRCTSTSKKVVIWETAEYQNASTKICGWENTFDGDNRADVPLAHYNWYCVPLQPAGCLNDRASSLQIKTLPIGKCMGVYEHANYNGDSIIYGPWSGMNDPSFPSSFNDRMSSIKWFSC